MARPSDPQSHGTGARILLVEDEAIIALDLETRLRGLGHWVIGTADSTDQAIALAQQLRPDLVLMDVRLRGPGDGIAAARQIRAELGVPIVFLTAFGDDETLLRARLTEPFGFLLKPIRDRDLRIALDLALDRHRIERKLLETEAQLRHVQKLEGLGVMASGIAHDFNNLLTPIRGYTSLARMNLPENSPVQGMLAQIDEASRRAADLTLQLLAYAGKAHLRPEPVDLSTLVRDMAALLSATAGRATLRYDLGQALPNVQVDPAQIRQVIVNLVTNAAEALADRGGAITIRTAACDLSAEELNRCPIRESAHPGAHVVLEVSDTGCGMDSPTLEKIFDPFFTTKFIGRGLGLAAVLGIVRSHHGALHVASTLHQGTTFRVFLPAVITAKRSAPEPLRSTRDGKILVVDADPTIQRLLLLVLHGASMDATAASLAEATRLLSVPGHGIGIVLLDVAAPGPQERALMEQIRQGASRPHVVVMSGHQEAEVLARLGTATPDGFLQKPFEPAALLRLLERLRS